MIEPRLSDQWFLSMEELVKPAIKAVLETKEIKLYPSRFENTYRHWLENIRDWNISRQLWWGQQIPAYFYGDGKEDFVVAENIQDALKLAQERGVTLVDKVSRKGAEGLNIGFLHPKSTHGVLTELCSKK